MSMMVQSGRFGGGVADDPNLLNFAKGALPAGVTYSGGTNGTRVNAAGLVVLATGPRFDYSPTTLAALGILCEPARTNLITSSESIDLFNSVGSASVAANTSASPRNDNTADTISLNSSFGHARKFEVPFPNSSVGAFSVYLKSPTAGAGVYLTTNNTADWNTGLSAKFAPTAVWGRGAIAGALGSGSGRIHTMIGNVKADSSSDPTIPTEAIVAWGAQLEVMLAGQRQEASTYIPTDATAVTRSADQISFTIPAGIASLQYTFDDGSTQTVAVSPGAYTVPTNLNRARIKTIGLLA